MRARAGSLPDDHLAWPVHDAVESLDIDALSDRYRMCGKGEWPYDPRMLLRVLIYAYCTGTFSSRKIAAQLEDSVAFRVLAENQMPGHRTICRFRERHFDQERSTLRFSGCTSLTESDTGSNHRVAITRATRPASDLGGIGVP